jgi:hypothetical protein
MCSVRVLFSQIDKVTILTPIPYNDLVQKGIDLLVGQSGSWAQVTGLFLAALAGLWVATGHEPRLAFSRRLWPEVVTWLAGVSMLVAALYCYHRYIRGMAVALEVGGTTSTARMSIPNVFIYPYSALLALQLRLLLLGSLASIFGIILVRVLQGGDDAGK